MHIAIDDTYGPEIVTASKFVTGNRRTHVAVVFQDDDVHYIRKQIIGCLDEVKILTGVSAKEFHFVDIYNRRAPWNSLPGNVNLDIFNFFAYIYRKYKWPVLIQTIDDRTLKDHGIQRIVGKIEDLDLSNRADLSLLWLLIKLKKKYKESSVPINLILDEGRRKSGVSFGGKIFRDWPNSFQGINSSSTSEPLLQITDFVAFCINRSTHLSIKLRGYWGDASFKKFFGRKIRCVSHY